MIKPSVDTDLIGKFIGEELYRAVLKNNTDQTIIAKKLGIKPNGVSVYLTGKTTTRNIEQYWRIANAIPISRKEFDQIVDEARQKVVGGSKQGSSEDPKVAFFAEVGVTDKNKQDAIMKMIEAFKDV